MPSAFAVSVQPQGDGGWTMESIREMAMVPDFLSDEIMASFDEEQNEKIPDGWYPHSFFNPLNDGDVDGCGCTKVFISPEMFMENGCLKEDIARTVDSHGYTKIWQQWKIKNAVVSMAMASTLALAFACRDESFIEKPFQLGNCLPRSILFPFNGLEGRGCRHLIKDSSIPWEYNASSYNTLAFIESSQKMSPEERWTNGNIIGSYVEVHEKVNNITKTVLKLDSASRTWKNEKHWIGRKNLYVATSALKRLVQMARSDRMHFIELDARKLKEWFLQSYVNHRNGKLKKGVKINARKDFPEIWKEWTGLRPKGEASASIESFSSFSEAFNVHGQDILDGRLVWTTHIEKIIRGLFIGSSKGMTLQEMIEAERSNERISAPVCFIEEKPKPDFIGTAEMEINVEFDPDGVQDALLHPERPLEPQVSGQLEGLLSNGMKDGERRWIRLHFRRRRHGRYYGHGNHVQMFPKWLRKKVFPSYSSIDLNCAVFSIMKSQLMAYGYEKDTPEMDSMVMDKDSYRKSLVDEENGISLENVKDFLTMIGYGCTMNIGRIVDAAEWNWLVEAYGIMPTLYDTYHYAPGSALTAGVNDPARLMQIASWASNGKVMTLWKEMQDGGSFLFKKTKSVIGGRPVLVNSWGEEMDIKSKRITFGQKLAHIYQGAESMLLWKIMDGLEIGEMAVKKSEYGFGLPMHDGFGLHRDFIQENPALLVEKYVSSNIGWNLKYECE